MPKLKKSDIPTPTFKPLRRVYVMKDGKLRNGIVLAVCWKLTKAYWVYELSNRLGWFNERRLFANREEVAARTLSR